MMTKFLIAEGFCFFSITIAVETEKHSLNGESWGSPEKAFFSFIYCFNMNSPKEHSSKATDELLAAICTT